MDAALLASLDEGATVLTASRRLAHHLRAEFATAAQARGLLVWPTPSILPWSTFLLEAARRQRGLADRPPRILSELQTLTLWENIVLDSEVPLLNPTQTARNALRSWQRLHQYRLSLAEVAESAAMEAQVFAAWARSFIDITERKHWLDAARLGAYLLKARYVPETPLYLCGFDRLTPEMQALTEMWRAQGCEARLFVEQAAVQQPADVRVVALNDERHELEAAARWARRQVEAGRSRIAVVIADLDNRAAQARRVFARIFAPDAQRAGGTAVTPAFTIAASQSLSDYAIVHHALLLLQLAQGRCDTLAVGQLLRSPFIAGYETETAARCLAELAARETRREYWNARELERFAAANGCMLLSRALQSWIQTPRETGRALPSQWAERCSAMLRQAGWPEGRALDSAELQTVVKLHAVLAELSALDELLGRIDFGRALRVLRDGCNAARFAPESDEQAVTLIDAVTVAGMRFDALWVTGLHAADWPPPPQPDPFLPLDLQRRHNLPEASAESCLQSARERLQRLVNSARDVVLSWPRHDAEAELQPSALLQSWPDAELRDLPQSPVRPLTSTLFEQRPELERFDDAHAPPLAAGAVAGGTRPLELQSRCPFRAQAELRLHAAPLPSVSPAVEPTERGQLVHKVLAEFWQQLQSLHALQSVGEEEWATRLRVIAARVAASDLPADTVHRQRLVDLEVELAVQWIMALLRVEARREPFTVRQAERREAIEFAGMRINIQLDRIDELPDGGWLLIDYKTSGSYQAGDWLDIKTPDRPRSPQLPLYALAHAPRLAGITYAVLCPEDSGFRGLANRSDLAEGIERYETRRPRERVPGVESWDELLRHWQTVLSTLARAYLAGEARVDPLPGECDRCHLAGLCRVHELGELAEAEEDGDE